MSAGADHAIYRNELIEYVDESVAGHCSQFKYIDGTVFHSYHDSAGLQGNSSGAISRDRAINRHVGPAKALSISSFLSAALTVAKD